MILINCFWYYLGNVMPGPALSTDFLESLLKLDKPGKIEERASHLVILSNCISEKWNIGMPSPSGLSLS